MLFVGRVFVITMAFAAYAARHLLRGRRRMKTLYAAGLALYVACFAVLEIPQNLLMPEASVAALLLLVEETGEMVAVTLPLW